MQFVQGSLLHPMQVGFKSLFCARQSHYPSLSFLDLPLPWFGMGVKAYAVPKMLGIGWRLGLLGLGARPVRVRPVGTRR